MSNVKRLVYSAVFLAFCLILPLITGQVRGIGQSLCPMHLPVILCGFICGWQYGAAVGFVAPFLRCAIFGMPPLFPAAISMALELSVYGLCVALFAKILPKKFGYIYVSLIISMICGRIVWGAARLACAGLSQTVFSFEMFISGAITTAIPGIIAQLLLVPPIVRVIERIKK